MINDFFKRMNVPSRTSNKGFLHNVLTESFVGSGTEGNHLFPVQEVEEEAIKRILDFVGKKGVTISKLASFMGMHYLKALDIATAMSSVGLLSFRTPDIIAIPDSPRRHEGHCVKQLIVWESDDSTHSSRKKCVINYVLEDSGIRMSNILDEATGEDVTDRVFIPRSIKEELNAKSTSSYERMKAVRRVSLF